MSDATAPVTPPVALSSASVFPESTTAAFELAAELGYDGVELMVWSDPISQRVDEVARLARRYAVPVVAVHAPCLLVSQRVWEADPIARIHRAAEAAHELGASTVIVHPPFRWQRDYVARFADELEVAEQRQGVRLAVENMYEVRRGRMHAMPYAPSGDPTDVGYRHYTLDLSHTAASGADALELFERMRPGLTHVHLADGSGSPRDEHLVPGRGNQPCAEICERLVSSGFTGTVVVEISTRRCRTRQDRAALLAEALLFARLHLHVPAASRQNVTAASRLHVPAASRRSAPAPRRPSELPPSEPAPIEPAANKPTGRQAPLATRR